MTVHAALLPRWLSVSLRAPATSSWRLARGSGWRRTLTNVLGVLWLLDAALQYQPYMFTASFPHDVIATAGAGSPGWISGPVSWSAGLMADHIVVWNTLFATGQLLIAIGLFIPALTRLALAGSIAWSLLVWWLGEGLGGVFAGAVSPLAGFPGAVVLYALIALLLWPPARRPKPKPTATVASRGLLGARGADVVWMLLWAGFAYETLRPADRGADGLHDLVAGAAEGEPSWIADINTGAAGVLAHHGTQISIVLAISFAFVGVSALVPRLRRAGALLAIVLAVAIWIVAQDFGEIATGTGTDPNSGLPLALLALCYWPSRARRRSIRSGGELAPHSTA